MSFVGGYEHVDQMPNHLLPGFSGNIRQRAHQQPKAEENDFKVSSIEAKSSQIQEITHFPKVLFIPPHLHFLQLIK